MKILVTGGAGFIGSNLVDALIDQKHEVFIIDNLSTGKKEFINPKVKFYEADIQDKSIDAIFKEVKPEILFHLAAHISVSESVKDPISDCKSNIEGSVNIFESAKNNNVKKVIFSSTGGALYGDTKKRDRPTSESYPAIPLSPYGITKLTNEFYLNYYFNAFNLNYTILRYSNVYGPRQNSKGEAGVVAIFIDKILNSEIPIIHGDGEQTRDYVYVDDVVKANILSINNKREGIYNIGTGIETSVNKIANLISNNFNKEIEIKHGPAVVEQRTSCLDNSFAMRELSWQPSIKLNVGIKKTVEWFTN